MKRWDKPNQNDRNTAMPMMRDNLSFAERLRNIASHMELPAGRKPKALPIEEAADLATLAGVTLPGKSLEGDISFLEDYTLKETSPLESSILNAKIDTLVKATVPSDKHSSLTTNGEKLDAIARQLGLEVEDEQGKSYSRRVAYYVAKAGIK